MGAERAGNNAGMRAAGFLMQMKGFGDDVLLEICRRSQACTAQIAVSEIGQDPAPVRYSRAIEPTVRRRFQVNAPVRVCVSARLLGNGPNRNKLVVDLPPRAGAERQPRRSTRAVDGVIRNYANLPRSPIDPELPSGWSRFSFDPGAVLDHDSAIFGRGVDQLPLEQRAIKVPPAAEGT